MAIQYDNECQSCKIAKRTNANHNVLQGVNVQIFIRHSGISIIG